MRRVAIIQARTGSSRLPGKVLKTLGDQKVLTRVVARVGAAERIDAVVVATSDLPGDDAIEALAGAHGWTCVRGSEQDVLSRFDAAVRESGADIVVRVTSDCPLFSPRILDEMLAAFDSETTDYMSTNLPERTFPVGLDCEVMRADALLTASAEATDPYDREHVTPFLYRNPDRFRIAGHAAPRRMEDIRITLDTPEDFARLEALVAARPEVLDVDADVLAIVGAYFAD